MGTYKEKYYKLKGVDDISQFLEDDSVALSTMKSSKFYSSFQTKIDEWEKYEAFFHPKMVFGFIICSPILCFRCLSVISEVVESLLSVQRKWIYLESIFMSGGDIAKQLPSEHALFVSVNSDFLKVCPLTAE